MMTNGKMEESIKGEAVLTDVEPQVFEQLVKFAYFGLCGMSDGVVAKAIENVFQVERYSCHNCSATSRSNYPFCFTNCREKYEAKVAEWRRRPYDDRRQFLVYCVVPDCTTRFDKPSEDQLLCSSHDREDYRAKYVKIGAQNQCLPNFRALNYAVGGLSHENITILLESHKDAPSCDLHLIHHAKLYVAASRYLVQDLPNISLHKLQRHLANLQLDDNTVGDVLDLMTFTYSHTEKGGDILIQKTDKLRELVMKYIVDQSEKFMMFPGFRAVLSAGGEHTADFIALKFHKPA